jgi:peptidoglycan/LPS O-acetylase OafA/YrhL
LLRHVPARIRQLDGLRGLAVIGVAWHHWAPRWRDPFPFEIGLFFFFAASGFLVTAGLLRTADRRIRTPLTTYRSFLSRRALRILIPYFAALALAAILAAGDVRQAATWYILPICNIHMALTGAEPAGITHFWTLAIQQQFYLAWPLLVLFLPRRALVPVITGLVLAAPLWRCFGPSLAPHLADPSLISFTALDYLGCGSLLAVARHHRPDGPLPGLSAAAWISFGGYVILYSCWKSGHPIPGIRWFQQTFFSVACCGLIDAANRGIRGPLGRLLESPALLHIGALSYSLYLLHNLSPFLGGHLIPHLWQPPFDSTLGELLRILLFASLSWILAYLSWRLLEQPLEKLRRKIPSEQ